MKLSSKRIRAFGEAYRTLLRSGPVLQLFQISDDVAQLEAENARLREAIQFALNAKIMSNSVINKLEKALENAT
jgi:hypothetical protein